MLRLFVLLLFPVLAYGQRNADVPLVMSARGPVAYAPQGASAPERVYAGNYLREDGNLILPEQSEVIVAEKDRLIKLEGPGRFALKDLFANEKPEGGFLSWFLNFVSRGFEDSASSENLEKSYERNQGNAQGNINGYGDRGLAGVHPFGGTLLAEPTLFTWPRAQDEALYRFRITDSLTGNQVASLVVRDTFIRLDLATLGLETGQRYVWEASRSTEPLARIRFGFDRRTAAEVLTPLHERPDFLMIAGTPLSRLMEAAVLERDGYLNAAALRYGESTAGEGDNDLLRRNHAAFLARWNLRSDAKELLRPSR